jgi:hypothetical protein
LKSKYENEILKIDKFSNKLRDKKEILVLIWYTNFWDLKKQLKNAK